VTSLYYSFNQIKRTTGVPRDAEMKGSTDADY
jgi:hypothetical protein